MVARAKTTIRTVFKRPELAPAFWLPEGATEGRLGMPAGTTGGIEDGWLNISLF